MAYDRRLLGRALLVPLVVGLAAACGSSGSGSTINTQGSQSSTSAVSVTTHVGSAGTYLTDGSGRSLYVFSADVGATSACTGGCLSVWPQFTASATPTASGSVLSSMLATAMQVGGKDQVTYAGHPLYYYQGDSSAGDTKGEGITSFGGTWNLVAADGTAIGPSGGAKGSSSGSYGSRYPG